MRNLIISIIVFSLILSLSGLSYGEEITQLSEYVSLIRGPVNGAIIEKDDARLVLYGDPSGKMSNAEMVLFTHSRRDVVWSGRKLVENGAISVVPDSDSENFSNVEQFWTDFATRRFHDYAQQGTKILTKPMKIGKTVRDGDSFFWKGIPVKVIETPGYTRQAVSYVIEVDDIRYAFVGDIIYGDGKLLDLYSLQDAVKEAKIGGYHGWAGRMGDLIVSLRKIAAEKPDILIPIRGPVIRNPDEAIGLLIQRLRRVYENYLSISAGRWYFKERYDILAARVLGPDPKVNWMPWAEVIEEQPPEWIIPISNSRLIVSEDRSGFLVDCGSRRIVNELIKLKDAGKLARLEGLFITHYHDDHTNDVNACLDEFNCPIYATGPSVDILEHPAAYRLPAMTPNPIKNIHVMPEGHKMRWKEFTFTFHDYPGQTIYHDALLVEKDNAEKIFFMGDSFTPSGIDDYCLLNRNLMHESTGYFYCLDLLRRIPSETLLINEHVVQPFRFSAPQLDHMTATFAKRKALLAELFPWDEPNYGIDERWIRFTPYGQKIKSGRTIHLSMKIFNHSDVPHTFTTALHLPAGINAARTFASITVPPRVEKQVDYDLDVSVSANPGTCVITADVEWDHWKLPRWTEAIIEIETQL
ncbi:MAG: MBL fold metallo-hydrolase [Sedimentisphaerales bacterium]|nr:MBL fold metallo-hydrolase [Sedimentisphaerales bacterium]